MRQDVHYLKPRLESFFENGLSSLKRKEEIPPDLQDAISSAREKMYLMLGEGVLDDLTVSREKWALIIEMVRASITKTDGEYQVGLFKLATIAAYLNSLEALDRAERNKVYPAGRLE